MPIHIVQGKNRSVATKQDIDLFCEGFSKVVIDVGAGDGKGSLRFARNNNQVAVIALDSSFDALEKTSTSALKNPSRGGASNLLCLYGNVRDAPEVLISKADLIRIYLPWGDLLEGIAQVDSEIISPMVDITQENSDMEIVVNAEIWKSNLPAKLEHLKTVNPDFFLERSEKFKELGIEIVDSFLMSIGEIKKLDTTWSAKLMSSRDVADFVMAKGVVKKICP